MIYAYRLFGASRTHEECSPDAENATVLPEGQRMIGITWNGGWDDYIVDLNDTVEVNEAEITGNARYWPTVKGEGRYLRGRFSRHLDDDKGYRIIKKIASGD